MRASHNNILRGVLFLFGVPLVLFRVCAIVARKRYDRTMHYIRNMAICMWVSDTVKYYPTKFFCLVSYFATMEKNGAVRTLTLTFA